MIKKIGSTLIYAFTLIILLISCCDLDREPEEDVAQGLLIDNLPLWTKDVLVSDWKPWNTEKTAEFKKLFKQKESINSENINYRLFVDGQNIVLFFDDDERSLCNPLRIWVAEYEEIGVYTISIPQEKEDEFVFTGYAKSNPAESNTEERKAYVKISLINSETGECNYVLKVNGKEIINEKLKACDHPFVEIPYSYFMEKFGYGFEEEQNFKILMFTSDARFRNFEFTDNRFVSNAFLYFEGLKEPPVYDESTKTFT
ncbi:MAG: hypothetical protein K6E78_06065, partial [Treponema sp.]|nr:hypothetical protein [Treponema sp.]